jgi:hypothetical protein
MIDAAREGQPNTPPAERSGAVAQSLVAGCGRPLLVEICVKQSSAFAASASSQTHRALFFWKEKS